MAKLRINKSEEGFNQWYKAWADKTGISPNPDDPEHYYDYRAAYADGVSPVIDQGDGLYHWPSTYKTDDHPNRFIAGVDTRNGRDYNSYRPLSDNTTHNRSAIRSQEFDAMLKQIAQAPDNHQGFRANEFVQPINHTKDNILQTSESPSKSLDQIFKEYKDSQKTAIGEISEYNPSVIDEIGHLIDDRVPALKRLTTRTLLPAAATTGLVMGGIPATAAMMYIGNEMSKQETPYVEGANSLFSLGTDNEISKKIGGYNDLKTAYDKFKEGNIPSAAVNLLAGVGGVWDSNKIGGKKGRAIDFALEKVNTIADMFDVGGALLHLNNNEDSLSDPVTRNWMTTRRFLNQYKNERNSSK